MENIQELDQEHTINRAEILTIFHSFFTAGMSNNMKNTV